MKKIDTYKLLYTRFLKENNLMHDPCVDIENRDIPTLWYVAHLRNEWRKIIFTLFVEDLIEMVLKYHPNSNIQEIREKMERAVRTHRVYGILRDTLGCGITTSNVTNAWNVFINTNESKIFEEK